MRMNDPASALDGANRSPMLKDDTSPEDRLHALKNSRNCCNGRRSMLQLERGKGVHMLPRHYEYVAEAELSKRWQHDEVSRNPGRARGALIAEPRAQVGTLTILE